MPSAIQFADYVVPAIMGLSIVSYLIGNTLTAIWLAVVALTIVIIQILFEFRAMVKMLRENNNNDY